MMAWDPVDLYRVGQGSVLLDSKEYILLEQKAEDCYLAVEKSSVSPAPVVLISIGATPTWVED